jgi:hypothetical protein
MFTPNPAYLLAYCERSGNAAFWGEPLNAITNGLFVLAGLAGLWMLLKRPVHQRSLWHWFFIVVLITIGIGSFLFHTIPNGVTVRLDTIPIGIFMLAYLTFALRYFVGAPWIAVAAVFAAFFGSGWLSLSVRCWGDGNIAFFDAPPEAKACANGSLGYGPALVSMWVIGAILLYRNHPAARLVLAASAVFLASITFRTFDFEWCDTFIACGRRLGTHFIWHTLNATTLFLLTLASLRHYPELNQIIPPRPRPAQAKYA